MTDEKTLPAAEGPNNAAPTKTIKNFRSIPEIEAFYRFVNNNDLRREAKLILEVVMNKIAEMRKRIKWEAFHRKKLK